MRNSVVYEAGLEQTDEELFAAFRGGDQVAFRQLYGRLNSSLHNFLFLRIRDQHALEDIEQNTWMKVVRYAHGFRGDSAVKSWIFSIAMNVYRQTLRDSSRRPQLHASDVGDTEVGDPLDRIEVPEENLHDPLVEELEQKVRESIRKAGPIDAPLLELIYFQDYSLQDAADAAGMSLAAVKSRVHRAKERIHEMLHGYLAA